MDIITGGKQTSAAASVHSSAFPFFFCYNIFFFLISAVGITVLQLVSSQISMESNNIKTEKNDSSLESFRETNSKHISKLNFINAIQSKFNENDKKVQYQISSCNNS